MFNCKKLFKLQIRPPSLILLITASQDRWIFPSQSRVVRNSIITAIGLSPGGSVYFTCTQNMKLVTTKFKSGGLHEKHVVATWNVGNHLIICLIYSIHVNAVWGKMRWLCLPWVSVGFQINSLYIWKTWSNSQRDNYTRVTFTHLLGHNMYTLKL